MAKGEVLLTGKVSVDCDFRPAVERDALVLLSKIGIGSVELIPSYRIKSAADKLEVARLVQTASNRITDLQDGYKSEKQKAHQAHATVCAHEKEDVSGWLSIRQAGLTELERWDRQQERIAQEAATKKAAEERQRALAAEAEARRIQQEADEAAAALIRKGEMSRAREVVAEAQEQAQTIVAEADALADVGVIEKSQPRIGFLGEARPWVAVIDDIKKVLGGIANGTVLLTQDELDKLAAIIEPILTRNYAKRAQKTDIGVPGAHGDREFNYRVSKKETPTPYMNREPAEIQEDW